MPASVDQLENVSVKLKANVYFDGGVISHTILGQDGSRQTIGTIRPGRYHFTTDAAEEMHIVAGTARVLKTGESAWKTVTVGEIFHVAGKSAFDIEVESGLAEYLCTFKG
jgi:uncharacterized protein YaiE (UPF0345 family)